MVGYSVVYKPRYKLVASLAIFSAVIGSFLVTLFSTEKYLLIIGLPTAIFSILFWLTDNFAWKLKVFKYLSSIPNLNGRWIGKISSTDRSEAIDVEVNIKQTWTSIRINLESSKDYSHCTTASYNPETKQISWIYFFYPNTKMDKKNSHGEGFAIVKYKSDKKIPRLVGRYQSSRGTLGDINLKFKK